MNAPEVLERITTAGIRLTTKGGNIVASPKAAVTPEVVELIRAHKAELLAAIEPKQSAPMSPDQRAALECFRELSAGIPVPGPRRDDRVRCIDCNNLREGDCQIERFSPVRDIPRRCGTFKPKLLVH